MVVDARFLPTNDKNGRKIHYSATAWSNPERNQSVFILSSLKRFWMLDLLDYLSFSNCYALKCMENCQNGEIWVPELQFCRKYSNHDQFPNNQRPKLKYGNTTSGFECLFGKIMWQKAGSHRSNVQIVHNCRRMRKREAKILTTPKVLGISGKLMASSQAWL